MCVISIPTKIAFPLDHIAGGKGQATATNDDESHRIMFVSLFLGERARIQVCGREGTWWVR